MTPEDLVLYAKQQYNAVTDTFFSDAELYTGVYDAQIQLALETNCIRNVYSTSTAVGQQEYTRPSNAISIKRITYNGLKLVKISDREDDQLTIFNQATTATGTPCYYWEWSTTLLLRPTPDAIGTLKIYSYDMPQVVAAGGTIDVPSRYHTYLANYLLARMCLKDKNFTAASQFSQLWEKNITDVKRIEQKLLRGDAFAHVIPEEQLPPTLVGAL